MDKKLPGLPPTSAYIDLKQELESVDSDDLVQILKSEKPYEEVQEFPGKPGKKFILRVLTESEQGAAEKAASKYAIKLHEEVFSKATKTLSESVNTQYYLDQKNRYCKELLFRSMRKLDGTPLLKSVEDIDNYFTKDIVEALVNRYWRLSVRVGPFINTLSEDELEYYIEKLSKAESSFFLQECTTEVQEKLLISLASLILKMRSKSEPDIS
jgi:hypothetical protein